jgi:hypothetical protein
MLFVLGILFIIVAIGITIYNKPNDQSAIEAILESSDYLDYDVGTIDFSPSKPNKRKKKKPNPKEPDVIIGDNCEGSLECPKDSGNIGHKNEQRCRKILEDIFKKPFPSVRPKWLKNPATKRNLELDMYCHDLGILNKWGKKVRLGVEFDGAQHSKMTGFHKNKTELLYQIRKDQYKDKRCKELGITLIRVPYWAHEDLKGYITRKLVDIGLLKKE